MKKLLVIVLALLLVLSLVACDTGKETTKDSDTETPIDSTSTPDESTSEPDESASEPDESTEAPESTETTEPESTETTEEQVTPPSTAFIEVKETVYVYGTDNLNIRVSYSVDSEVVGQMKEGESVIRTGYNDEWSRISYFGEIRYANSAYLTTVAPFDYTNKSETVYVISEQLNLRIKASPEASIVETLKYGDAIERTGVSTTKDENGYEWSRLLYNGQVCYANSIYLSTTPSISDTLIFSEQSDVIYTTAEVAVNLREDASIDSKIVASLGYGTRLERTGLATTPDADGVVWNRVVYNGKTCYISSTYITTEATVSFTDADETLYVTDNLNLRSIPSYTGSTVIRTLAKGTAVKCIGKATAADSDGITWYKVIHNETTGYVSASYLATEQPS